MAGILSRDELKRYNRQLILPEVAMKGQEKLKNARVLVIGAGGLGCPVLLYLAGVGVGTIGIVDFDTIEVHNLHRQVLFDTADIGNSKTLVAAEKLKAKNPFVKFVPLNEALSESNAQQLMSDYDVIVDGSDNFATRYLVNDTCVLLNKPLIYGTILKNEGQLAVFNLNGSKNLRDIYPESPNPEDVPSCDQNGVLGFVPGIIGTFMSNLAIQVVLGETHMANKLFFMDLKQLSIQTFDY